MKTVLAVFLLVGCATASPLPNEPIDGLLPLVSMIKGILSTSYGFQELRTYLLALDAENPIVQEVHHYIHTNSQQDLRDAVNAFFADVPVLAIDPGFEYPSLATLFGEVKAIILTDEGIEILRDYLDHVKSTQPILRQVLDELAQVDNDMLKVVASALLSHVDEVIFDAPSDFESQFVRIIAILKARVTTPAGLKVVRDHLNNLQTTNPNLILAKTILSAMSDKALIDLVKELGKNIPDIQLSDEDKSADILELIGKGKNFLVQPEGIKFVRDYMDKLQTGNFLVVRVKGLLKGISDEKLVETIENGFTEIFGSFLAAPADVVSELRNTLSFIKPRISSSYGIKLVRDHLNNLETTNPTLILAKTVLAAMSEKSIIDLVKEVTKNLPDIEVEEGFEYPGLLELIAKAKDLVVTDEGIDFIRTYFDKLETSHFLVLRLKGLVKNTSNQKFKETVLKGYDEIFGYSQIDDELEEEPTLEYATEVLHAVLSQIKVLLKNERELKAMKSYLVNLKPQHPLGVIFKAHFSALPDSEKLAILQDFLRNIPEIQIEPEGQMLTLLDSFGVFKIIVNHPLGLQALRDYTTGLQPTNEIVKRMQVALETVDDDTLIAILNDVLQGVPVGEN